MDTYDDNNHRIIKTTPNKTWTNDDLQPAHNLIYMIYNEQVYKAVPFKSGENDMILEEEETFGEGTN